MTRKIFSLILILTMLVSLLGFNYVCYAFADVEFAGGSGTEADPWQIASAIQLNNVRNYLGTDNRDKHFILTDDIDLNIEPYNTGIGWEPIGDWWDSESSNFQGTFDGDNHTISGLFINMPDAPVLWDETDSLSLGLFGEVYNATIKNINLAQVDVTGYDCVGGIAGNAAYSILINIDVSGTVTGNEYAGGLTGYTYKCFMSDVSFVGSVYAECRSGGVVGNIVDSTIRNSSNSGIVGGNNSVGGLVGESYSSSIFESHSESSVTGTSDSSLIGGLVGLNGHYSTIDKSYATGVVNGTEQLGGLVGSNSLNSKVINSFASGNVSSIADDINKAVGGLVGLNDYASTIENCYAVGLVTGTGYRHGGLLGDNYTGAPILSSYSLGPDNDFGEVVTEEQMKTQATFTEWDFDRIWGIEEGSYPYLMQNVADAEIISLLHDSSFNVPYGTTFDDLNLPFTVFVLLDDNTTVPIQVTWNDGNPLYDGNIPGDYVFTGTLTLVDGIANSSGHEAMITVTVWIEPKEIISVDPLPDITVPLGTDWNSIDFPLSVNVTLEDNSTTTLPVTWKGDSFPSYNSELSGTYLLMGKIETGIGEANTAIYFASVNIIVELPVDSTPVITDQPEDLSVKVGETAAFFVGYAAKPDPTLQWQFSKNGGKKWSNISDSNSSSYEVTQATIAMNGYLYRVILDNGVGSPVTSSAVKLTVTDGTADMQISQQEGVYDSVTNEIVWFVRVNNGGPDTAQGVTIKNTLANNTRLLSVTVSNGLPYSLKGKTITVNVGEMEANHEIGVEIRVLVTRVTSPITNMATVTSTCLDLELGNNTTTSEVLIQ
jgi:uncharacterized repeat protein (TIGR01451 family)